MQLFREGYAPRIIFSGGMVLDATCECSSAELSMQEAVRLGLNEESCVLIKNSESTFDEAEKLHALANSRGWKSFILITDHFSSTRAVRTFRKVASDLEFISSPSIHPLFRVRLWWQTENGLVAVFSETTKMLFYWCKYGIRPIF